MSSKNEILERLRKNVRETYAMPDLTFQKTEYADPVAEYIKQTTTTAAAKLIEVKAGDDLNQLIQQAYPEAKVIASVVPGVKATINPDEVAEAQELDKVDVTVLEGGVACAENACVWIPMNMKQKACMFTAVSLVVIVSRKNTVSNMHQAYKFLEDMGYDNTSKYGFGTFMSGASKTADIEQTLVYGAQAATSMTVLLTE